MQDKRNEILTALNETKKLFPSLSDKRLIENVERLLNEPGARDVKPTSFFQQPTLHFYHGLESQPFLNKESLNLQGLIDSADLVRAEFGLFMSKSRQKNGRFDVFRDGSGKVPEYLSGPLNVVDVISPSDTPGKAADSKLSEEFFPHTRAALMKCVGFANSAFFSLMHPGTHLKPHYSESNVRYTVHLGVQIPNGDCFLRVAEEKRKWNVGKTLAFDGSYLHEAWNFSDHLRVILIANFWHPDLNDAEKYFIETFDSRINRSDVHNW